MALRDVTVYMIIAIISLALYFIKNRLSYWKKRGVPHDEPKFFYGNMKDVSRTRQLRDKMHEMYTKYKGAAPFIGFYLFMQPICIVTDLDLIKRVLIKDFNNFIDRAVYHNEKDDPLTGNLFGLPGNRWRELRSKLTPTFTSSKMKLMFPIVVEVGNRFLELFRELVAQGSVVEVKELLARFSTDTIGTCAFGIECNSLKDPKSEFRIIGQRFINNPRHNRFILAFIRSCPDLARALGCRTVPDDVHNFFMRIVRETVEHREKNGIVRNDFLNMMIALKNNKTIETANGQAVTGLTMAELTAQVFGIFFGGFETSSSTMGYALFELAQNQNIQDKLRTEINDVLAKHNGELSYEGLKEMPYMTKVVFETLRKYTLLTILSRVTQEDYYISGTKYKIDKGTMIFIPADAIHRDPEYYPNPDVFDPERFSPEQIQKRPSMTFMPFGDGPRNCIGRRFGEMQTYIGLSLIVKNFKLRISDQMKLPMEFDVTLNFLSSRDGIHLSFEPIK